MSKETLVNLAKDNIKYAKAESVSLATGTMKIPASDYTDNKRWIREKNKLFNSLMVNLWENFYQKYIDSIADIVYGYSITTHKSQGSNYKVVFVDMENIITCNTNQQESYRCLYTAITRTSKYLNILK